MPTDKTRISASASQLEVDMIDIYKGFRGVSRAAAMLEAAIIQICGYEALGLEAAAARAAMDKTHEKVRSLSNPTPRVIDTSWMAPAQPKQAPQADEVFDPGFRDIPDLDREQMAFADLLRRTYGYSKTGKLQALQACGRELADEGFDEQQATEILIEELRRFTDDIPQALAPEELALATFRARARLKG